MKMWERRRRTTSVNGMSSCLRKCAVAASASGHWGLVFTFFYTPAATAKPMHSRFASVYSYDFELFRQRFLGEEGATQLKPVVGLAQCTCSKVTASSSFHAWKPFELQAIDRFWETMRPSEFFRQHPVLSDPATFLHFICGCRVPL